MTPRIELLAPIPLEMMGVWRHAIATVVWMPWSELARGVENEVIVMKEVWPVLVDSCILIMYDLESASWRAESPSPLGG